MRSVQATVYKLGTRAEKQICPLFDRAIEQEGKVRNAQSRTLRNLTRARGVTTSDGARGKKQVWCHRVRNWGLSEANSLYWRILVTLLGLFGAPRNHSAPGDLRLSCHPLLSPPRYSSDYSVWKKEHTTDAINIVRQWRKDQSDRILACVKQKRSTGWSSSKNTKSCGRKKRRWKSVASSSQKTCIRRLRHRKTGVNSELQIKLWSSHARRLCHVLVDCQKIPFCNFCVYFALENFFMKTLPPDSKRAVALSSFRWQQTICIGHCHYRQRQSEPKSMKI